MYQAGIVTCGLHFKVIGVESQLFNWENQLMSVCSLDFFFFLRWFNFSREDSFNSPSTLGRNILDR